MSPPRIPGIVSGVAASTAVFLVLTRWHLAGTLAGAAIAPVIYILVSHGSLHGVESLGARIRQGRTAERDPDGPDPSRSARVSSEKGTPPSGRSKGQRWLAGSALLALSLSICAIVLSDYGGKTVARETVIQTVPAGSERTKTATATGKTATTIGVTATTASAPATAGSPGETSSTTQTAGSTDTTGAQTSSTTATTLSGTDDTSTSTTDAVTSSTVSLP